MKPRKDNMVTWFIVLSSISVLFTVGVLFASHGEAFSKIFFKDIKDTGMDFFHSIEYVRGRSPYALFNTLYPPLANLLFYVLICFVPAWQYESWASSFSESVGARATSIDLRVWQPTMMLFIMFILISTALLLFLVQAHAKKESHARASMYSLCVLFSYGVLYSFERGNIIILAFLSCLFFVRYRNSKRPVMRYLSLVMLAISAGLKIYPALFGLLLLYDKQYKKAAATVVLGVLMLVFPALVFLEGFSGISMFFKKLSEHVSVAELSTDGFCFDRICNAIIVLFSSALGVQVNHESWLWLSKLNAVMAGVILLCGFFMQKKWQKSLVCCMAMLLYSFQYTYAAIFFLIPLIGMISEEKRITKKNAFMFFVLVFSVVLLPIQDIIGFPISIIYGRFQLCMIIFTGYILVEAWNGFLDDICKFFSDKKLAIHKKRAMRRNDLINESKEEAE